MTKETVTVTVKGTEVVLRKDPPASLVYSVLPYAAKVKAGDNLFERIPFDKARDLVKGMVVSWSFDGDPGQDSFYEDMDADVLMNVFMPVVVEAYKQMAAGLVPDEDSGK